MGLGDISLKSALNQPLDAEIELLEVRDLGNGEVIPALAAVEEFNKVGVERPYFLTDLKFTPVLRPNGKSVIRVTSSKPVREPYLNFLVEVLWPNGRLLREYTVLLDPPLYSPQTVAAVAPSLPQVAVAPRSAAAAPARPVAPAAPAAAAPAAPLQDGQYRVGREDTLWQIAERARPSSTVSVHQTMLAIQDLNPDAFLDGNINRLKNGQVLRLPSEAQVRSRSQADALAQVQAQNVAWREGRAVQPVAAARQLDATRRSRAGDAPAQAAVEDNLRLVSAAAGKATSGSDNGAAADSQGLADQLAVSQESLATSRRENQELKERLSDLQSQLDKLQRLIELKNEQLAKLQGSLAADGEAPLAAAAQGEPAADVQGETADQPLAAAADGSAAQQGGAEQPVVASPAESQPQAEPAAEPVAAAAPAEAKPAEAAPVAAAPKPATVKPAARPVAPAPVQEPSLLDEVLADPLLLAAGGGALALLAGLGLMVNARRRKQAAQAFDEPDGDPSGEPVVAAAAPAVPAASAAAAGAAGMPAKSADPLGEAEMYSTYGRFTQAAELLRNAINEEPQRIDLRLKLMEICAEMGDREGFVRQEAELGEIGGAQPQIDQLRARYPQILASAAAIAVGSAAAADALGFSAEARVAEPPAAAAEFSLDDFGLDDLQADAAGKTERPAVSAAESDAFDLSLDDLEAELERELAAAPQGAGEAPLALDELTLDGLGDDLASLEPAAAPTQAALESDGFDFDLQLDAVALPGDAPAASGDELAFELGEGVGSPAAVDEDPFAELDRLELDGALLSETPAAASAESGDDLFAELDQLSLDADLPAETAVAAAVEEAGADPFAELDHLALDDALLLDEVQAPAVQALPEAADEEFDELLAELPGLDLAEPAGEAAATDLELGALDDLELELQALDAGSDSAKDLDAAFDEFLAHSVGSEPAAAAAELPALDDLVVEPVSSPALSGEEDFNFLADTDETATKLELARAYIDMGDADGARDILDEVLKEGSASQQQEAREMMGRIA
ncbi:peptigoglycan-binding protein LysM [Pseudomonas stutzeri]|nr:peptigoglycan-binding protein LysM [Stutzerimonas stutzeri]